MRTTLGLLVGALLLASCPDFGDPNLYCQKDLDCEPLKTFRTCQDHQCLAGKDSADGGAGDCKAALRPCTQNSDCCSNDCRTIANVCN